jgi:hypothetical protein
MKALFAARAALAGSLAAVLASAPVMAAPASQPPMNAFQQAFYNCDDNGAFLIAYNSGRPTTATMTTSSNNKEYALKRVQGAGPIKFSSDTAKIRIEGDQVTVEGTETPYLNCKRKTD